MPDDTNQPPTPADIAAAQTQAEQLTSDLAKTNDIDTTYHECEALLHLAQSDLAQFQKNLTTNAPAAPDIQANAGESDEENTAFPAISEQKPQTITPPSDPDQLRPALDQPRRAWDQPPLAPADGTGESDENPESPAPSWATPTAGFDVDALQAAAAQVSQALEQNFQGQLSLYEHILELLGAQNRTLDELDRRTSELSNQLKSLKNR